VVGKMRLEGCLVSITEDSTCETTHLTQEKHILLIALHRAVAMGCPRQNIPRLLKYY
jgi:hypothetical protein